MTPQSRKAIALYLTLAGLRPLSAHRLRNILVVVLAVCPSIVCAWLAEISGGWDLFALRDARHDFAKVRSQIELSHGDVWTR